MFAFLAFSPVLGSNQCIRSFTNLNNYICLTCFVWVLSRCLKCATVSASAALCRSSSHMPWSSVFALLSIWVHSVCERACKYLGSHSPFSVMLVFPVASSDLRGLRKFMLRKWNYYHQKPFFFFARRQSVEDVLKLWQTLRGGQLCQFSSFLNVKEKHPSMQPYAFDKHSELLSPVHDRNIHKLI